MEIKERLLLTFIKFIQAGKAAYHTIYINTQQYPYKFYLFYLLVEIVEDLDASEGFLDFCCKGGTEGTNIG